MPTLMILIPLCCLLVGGPILLGRYLNRPRSKHPAVDKYLEVAEECREKHQPIDLEAVLHTIEEERGILPESPISENPTSDRYEFSKQYPGMIEKVSQDGSRALGSYVNGRFTERKPKD